MADIADVVEGREERVERLEAFASDAVTAIEAIRRRVAATEERLSQSAPNRLRAVIEDIRREIRPLPYMAGKPLAFFDDPQTGRVIGFRDHGAGASTQPYVAFEDVFRGPAPRVEEAQRPYVSLVTGHEPVVDIGCGRGEFLGLLAEAGLTAHGVDPNEEMVTACRERGLTNVEHADANAYLERVSEGALGAIFAAQVIEHMAYPEWHRFLELSRRALMPGGVLIFETVNPHRLASLKTFWVDPTHWQPIFPEVALVVCRIVGFHAAHAFAPGGRDFEAERFTADAYAVLAQTEPEAGDAGAKRASAAS